MHRLRNTAWRFSSGHRRWGAVVCALLVVTTVFQESCEWSLSQDDRGLAAVDYSDGHDSEHMSAARSETPIWIDSREISSAEDEAYGSAIPSWLDGSILSHDNRPLRSFTSRRQQEDRPPLQTSFQLATPLQI